MEYQEFDSGNREVLTALGVQSEVSIGAGNYLSFDVFNTGAVALNQFKCVGYESISMRESDPTMLSELFLLNSGSNLSSTALASSNYYHRIKRIVGSANPGILAAGTDSMMSCATLQQQHIMFQATCATATTIRVCGIVKGAWEGNFNYVDQTTAAGQTIIDCKGVT